MYMNSTRYDSKRDVLLPGATQSDKDEYEKLHNGYGWMLFYRELHPEMNAPYLRWDGVFIDLDDFREDDDPDSWITLENGEHVPLDESGNAIGGAGGWAKGKNFSNAKTVKKTPKVSGVKAKLPEYNKNLDDLWDSEESYDDKYPKIRKLIKECPVGMTLSIADQEFTKLKDTDDESEFNWAPKNDNFGSWSIRDVMHTADWEMQQGNKPKFSDREDKRTEIRNKISDLRKEGKLSGTEEVSEIEKNYINHKSEDFGKPGKYIAYRTGDIGTSGMVFFHPKKEGADEYSGFHDKKTGQYTLDIKNPLIINGTSDVDCVMKAYEALHNGQKKVKSSLDLTSSKWMQMDKANASALGKYGHDALIYMVNGEPHEIQLPAKNVKKNNLEKLATYSTTEWSRLGSDIEDALYYGRFNGEDYQRIDSNFDSDEEPDDIDMAYYTVKMRNAKKTVHKDEKEPEAWITINGSHIPLDKNGVAIGGFAKGKSFKKAYHNPKLDKFEVMDTLDAMYGEEDSWAFSNNGTLANHLGVMGLDKKPDVMSEDDFTKYVKDNNAQVIHRGVSDRLNWEDDEVEEKAEEIIGKFKTSDKNSMGGGNYGSGYHFWYGDDSAKRAFGFADGKKQNVIEAALKPDARVIDFDKLKKIAEKDYDDENDTSALALLLGYDAISSGSGVINVINRGALVVNDGRGRFDADEPASWITLENGEHVPLDANGNAICGADGLAKGNAVVLNGVSYMRQDGGPGSGNFGHEGRPGKIGGSAPDKTPEEFGKTYTERIKYRDGIYDKFLEKKKDYLPVLKMRHEIREAKQSHVRLFDREQRELSILEGVDENNLKEKTAEMERKTQEAYLKWNKAYGTPKENDAYYEYKKIEKQAQLFDNFEYNKKRLEAIKENRKEYDREYEIADKEYQDAKEKMRKIAQEYEDELSEYNKAVLSKFPDYDSIKNGEDASEYLLAKGYVGLKEDDDDRMVKVGGVPKTKGVVKLENVNPETARDLCKTVDKIHEKYPELARQISSIVAQESEGELGNYGANGILYSIDYLNDKEEMSTGGFHPRIEPNNAVGHKRSTVAHEYGHALDEYLAHKYPNEADYVKIAGNHFGGSNETVSPKIFKQAAKNLGITQTELKKRISGYACKNALEALAEAFGEYIASDNPRPEAKEIGRQIDHFYQYGKTIGKRQ